MRIYKTNKIIKLFIIALTILSAMPLLYSQNSVLAASKADEKEKVSVPIIMYHDVRKSNHGKFVISPKEIQSDLDYLKTNGYNTVVMAELIAFVENGYALPKNPIVLTFDDGDFGVYKYAYPQLKEHGFKAVMSIIGRYTDMYSNEGRTDINYPHFTWQQVQQMNDDGVAEFQNHSYDLHCGLGACKTAKESDEVYYQRLKSDLTKMQLRTEQMTGVLPTTFTYPFGKLNKHSEQIVKDIGFKASLSCFEGKNILTHGNNECLYKLNRYNRPHGKPISSILKSYNALK